MAAFVAALTVIVCLATPPVGIMASGGRPVNVRPSDPMITDAIAEQMRREPILTPYMITIFTHDGIVTLEGTVTSYLAREVAFKIAARTRGVLNVVNDIHVKPEPRPDSEIRKDIVKALTLNPNLRHYPLDIAVADGRVSVSGIVDNPLDRKEIEETILRIRGVGEVRSHIRTGRLVSRTNRAIRSEIINRLDTYLELFSGIIEVAVTDEEVILSGSVRSYADKIKAYELASIDDSRVVRITDLHVVADGAALQLTVKPDTKPLSDREIEDLIRSTLLVDPQIRARGISVTAENGVVILGGTVETLRERSRIATIARGTPGVTAIQNHIALSTAIVPGDRDIAYAIAAAIERHPVLYNREITVLVQEGVARLIGNVKSLFEREQATEVAEKTRGVIAVENTLRVRNHLVRDTDETLRIAIEEALYWNAVLDSDEITVTVRDGEAVLTGHVASWREFYLAAHEAFKAGALAVRNRLTITGAPDVGERYYKTYQDFEIEIYGRIL